MSHGVKVVLGATLILSHQISSCTKSINCKMLHGDGATAYRNKMGKVMLHYS